MLDAEAALRKARRPLVIGMGGGGDIVGALATAELARRYDGAAPVLGGLANAIGVRTELDLEREAVSPRDTRP